MEVAPNSDLETIYRQVVDLGQQARGWFDGPGTAWRAELPIEAQAIVATESLRTTARLLGMMSWLLDPAHAEGRRPDFLLADDLQAQAADSPLVGTPGGEIVDETRRLVAVLAALGAARDPGGDVTG